MFNDWGGRKVSEYWGNVLRCSKSGFTVNWGAVSGVLLYWDSGAVTAFEFPQLVK